jgi:hypothetical protein
MISLVVSLCQGSGKGKGSSFIGAYILVRETDEWITDAKEWEVLVRKERRVREGKASWGDI